MNNLRLWLGVLLSVFSICTIDAGNTGQLGKAAKMATELYNALRGYINDEKSGDIEVLMNKAKKRGFSEEDQLNAVLEHSSKNNDQDVARRVRSILRKKYNQEIKNTVHRWGAAILALQLAIGGVIIWKLQRSDGQIEGVL